MDRYFLCDMDTYDYIPENGDINCKLCPHKCSVKMGKPGFCNIRKNFHGVFYLSNFGEIIAPVIDTLKKRPILTYEGDDSSLTLGLTGCNNRCNFCQNYKVSARADYQCYEYMSPINVVEKAIKEHVSFISFTYTEPLIWGEYMSEIAKRAKKYDIKICIKTAANINCEYHDRYVQIGDVFNVDIKPCNDEFLKKSYINNDLVLLFIKKAIEAKKHIEISHIVIEGLNDNEESLEKLVKMISDHKEIPIHLLPHIPTFISEYRATSKTTLNLVNDYLNQNGFKNVFINGD
jgi:pyruvate formate lyase activating enzyme